MTPSPNPSSEELDELFAKYYPVNQRSPAYLAIRSELLALIDAARKAGEDTVLEIADHRPCDCGSNDHFPVPVRSVTGSVTYYCQFSRVVPSALSHPAPEHKSDKEGS